MSAEIIYIDFASESDETGSNMPAPSTEFASNVTPIRDGRKVFYGRVKSDNVKESKPTVELDKDRVAYFMNTLDYLISLELQQLPRAETDERWGRVRTFLYRRCEQLYLVNRLDANDILLELPDIVHTYYMLGQDSLPALKARR